MFQAMARWVRPKWSSCGRKHSASPPMPCRKSNAGPLSPTAMQLGVAVIAGRPCPSARAFRRGSGRGELVATIPPHPEPLPEATGRRVEPPAPRRSCEVAEQPSRFDNALAIEGDGAVAHRQVEMPERVAPGVLVGAGRIEEIPGEGA